MSTAASPAADSLPVHEHEEPVPRPSLWRRYISYRYFNEPELNTRPSARMIFRAKFLDTVIIALVGVGIQLSYLYVPSTRTAFFRLNDPSLSKPLQPVPLGVHADAWLTLVIPEVIYFLLYILWVRSFWDLINATTGHGFAIATATLFQMVIKKFAGRLRPHFYDVCRPGLRSDFVHEAHLSKVSGAVPMYDVGICMGEEGDGAASVPDHVFESFPSGHVTAAFAAGVYMSLFLNGKMKLWPEKAQSKGGVKLLVVFAPVLLASLMAVAMFRAGWHHASDVVVGSVIGTLFAVVSYRMMYVSVLDPRTNHLPLLDKMLVKSGKGGDGNDDGEK